MTARELDRDWCIGCLTRVGCLSVIVAVPRNPARPWLGYCGDCVAARAREDGAPTAGKTPDSDRRG